jgi:hypothetical protein
MRLDFPKTASVKDYLRTLDFESSEVKVHWSDERGEWLRQTFTSRPDNVVVQLLTAPKGQSVNARIALESSSGRRMRPNAAFRGTQATSSGESEIQQDFNEQRLIYKCRLDPSVDNSGYAGVVRVVRNGGSARMDNGTLVIENASSVMLLTRIEWFADYSEDKVEALRRRWKGSPRTIRRCWSGTARSSRRPSTASPWISAAPLNMDVFRGTSGRSEVAATGLFARVAGEDLRDGTLLVHPHQRQVLQHVGRGQCQYQPANLARCRAICGKAWMPTSIGWRAWPRTSGSTQRTSSGCAAHIIPSCPNKGSASRSITPAPHRPGRCGRIPTGFPPEAGVFARSGITIWSPATWNSSASAWCRPIKSWRCFTRIS